MHCSLEYWKASPEVNEHANSLQPAKVNEFWQE